MEASQVDAYFVTSSQNSLFRGKRNGKKMAMVLLGTAGGGVRK
jgi:hypothetical protein